MSKGGLDAKKKKNNFTMDEISCQSDMSDDVDDIVMMELRLKYFKMHVRGNFQ